MNTTRAQISIFLIISILVLFIGTYLIFFINQGDQNLIDQEKISDLSTSTQEIKETVESCLQLGTEEQLQYNLLSGGYYELPPQFVHEYNFVSLYIFDDNEQIPTIEVLEHQLELAVEDNIGNCIQDLRMYNKSYQDISIGSFNVEVDFTKNFIISTLKTDISLTSKQTGAEIDLNTFMSELDSKILEHYDIVNMFIEIHNNDYSQIPISDLVFMAQRENFTYEMITKNDNLVIYTLDFKEKDSSLTTYQFAIEYDWGFD